MRVRRNRKVQAGNTNKAYVFKKRVKTVPVKDRKRWLNFMSLPKKTMQTAKEYTVPQKINENPLDNTKKFYKEKKKQVVRDKDILKNGETKGNPIIEKFNVGESFLDRNFTSLHSYKKEKKEINDEIMSELNNSGRFLSKKAAISRIMQKKKMSSPKLRPMWTLKDFQNGQNSSRKEKIWEKDSTLSKAKEVIASLNERMMQKSHPMEVIKAWDLDGKGYVTKENVEKVLKDQGYRVKEKEVEAILELSKPGNDGKVQTADIYKMLRKGEDRFEELHLDPRNDEVQSKSFIRSNNVKSIIANAYKQKQKQHNKNVVLTLLRNDVKSIKKEITQRTEKGFVNPEIAKDILMRRVKKYGGNLDRGAVDLLLKECSNSCGVDSFAVVEKIADSKTKDKIDNQKARDIVNKKFDNDIKVYTEKLDDTTLKKNDMDYHRLAQKINPVQRGFNQKFKSETELKNFLKKVKDSNKPERLSKGDIYRLYQDVKGRKLSVAEKRDLYRFCQNLKFREREKTVSHTDLTNLIYGKIDDNKRLDRISHHPYPIEPLVPLKTSLDANKAIDRTPSIADSKYKKILNTLNSTLEIKKKSKLEKFRLFDQDKDGLVKKQEFANTLSRMNICNEGEASQIFDKFSKNKNFLNFTDFQNGLHTPFNKIRSFTLPKFGLHRSQPNINIFKQRSDFKGRNPHDTKNYRTQLMMKNFHNLTEQNIKPVKNSAMYMSDHQLYDRSVNHRIKFQRDSKSKRDRILEDKLSNTREILSIYDNMKKREESLRESRYQAKLNAKNNRKMFYENMINTHK